MSKTVKIPNHMKPMWECVVNGTSHKYPAGTTQEVPDAVAAVIEGGQAVKPKLPKPTPPSWNDLSDKPFGESETGGDTLTWDGNTEGLVSFDVEENGKIISYMYKISDAVPTQADFANGCTVNIILDGNVVVTNELSAEQIESVYSEYGFVPLEGLYIVPEDNFQIDGGVLPEAGVYHLNPEALEPGVIFSLTIPGYTGFPSVKTIEPKYLPGPMIMWSDGTYLYNSEDTSDETNRIPLEQLRSAFYAGRCLYLGIDGIFISLSFFERGDYGGVTYIVLDEIKEFYTAEYTP